ncbi:MAG TPA: class I SAM-dependent methyltransferase [Vicingus sp.]|nr:class I SAM-dependent methyltransferase [Vicingus sp.]
MKNILNEKPTSELHGRLLEAVRFVSDDDVKNKTVLDIGCGYGWCEIDFLKRGVKKIVGTEITNNDLNTAKKYIKNSKVEFVVAGATKLPFPNNTFNTLVSWQVIEHIPKDTEVQMFSEVNRVLKKGGTFYLSTPYRHIISNILDPAWWLIGHRHYSKKQLFIYAKSNGFKVEKSYVKGKFFQAYAWVDMYIWKWVFKRRAFYIKQLDKKIDKEYDVEDGYANIFVKFRKK